MELFHQINVMSMSVWQVLQKYKFGKMVNFGLILLWKSWNMHKSEAVKELYYTLCIFSKGIKFVFLFFVLNNPKASHYVFFKNTFCDVFWFLKSNIFSHFIKNTQSIIFFKSLHLCILASFRWFFGPKLNI